MKYIVQNAAGETVDTKSKKSTALDSARAYRDENREAVSVQTEKGTVVLELAAPKKINMSPRYTRVVSLPEGVEVPEGARVAYFRPRVQLALLHFAGEDVDPEAQYAILDTKAGRVLKRRFPTTRAGGVFLRERAEARKAKLAAQAAEQEQAPANA